MAKDKKSKSESKKAKLAEKKLKQEKKGEKKEKAKNAKANEYVVSLEETSPQICTLELVLSRVCKDPFSRLAMSSAKGPRS
jgi:hypothetical protein